MGGGSGGGTGGGDDAGTGGGTGGGADAGTPDAGTQDAGVACNPLAAPGLNGCSASQKCAWIVVQETPMALGQLGCVPDGTVARVGTCAQGPTRPTTGYDDCAATNTCIGGRCEAICEVSGGTQCAGYGDCTRYSGLFANEPDAPTLGACSEGCDPLSQTRFDGGSCGVNKGCYLLTGADTTAAICAGAGTVGHNQDITGNTFANSCVPGAMPRRKDSSSLTMQCGGLCRPADVTSTMNTSQEAGVGGDNCVTRWGAAPPADATAGESCRYYWGREPFTTLSPFSNTVGWGFKHAVIQYDSDGDTTPDALVPRCAALTTGDVVPPLDGVFDALSFWCVASPSMRGRAGGAVKPAWASEQPRLDCFGGWR